MFSPVALFHIHFIWLRFYMGDARECYFRDVPDASLGEAARNRISTCEIDIGKVF